MAETPTDPSAPVEVNLKKVTVLVVEDEEVIRDVICAFLAKIGVRRVVAVGNAEDAIYQLEDDEETPINIVLIDLMLPGASGLALLKTMREHKSQRLQNMPVVVVTSYTSMKVYRKAAEFDINGYLRKPIGKGALEEAIIKALGGKVAAKALENFKGEGPSVAYAKKPGILETLFGGGTTSPKDEASAQKKKPKTQAKPTINRNV